jgi:hypothetical protein
MVCCHGKTKRHMQKSSLHAFSPYDLVTPQPTSPSPVRKLDWRHTGRLRKGDNLLTEEGGWDGGGAKSYDGEKAWSHINHSILSGITTPILSPQPPNLIADSLIVFKDNNCVKYQSGG